MSEHEPKRLLDELAGGDLRTLLEAGKSETPSDRQMMLLAAKVGIVGGLGGAGAGGAGGGAGAGGAGAATAVKAGLAVKIAGGLAVAGAIGTGAVVATNQADQTATATASGLIATPTTPAASATDTSRGGAALDDLAREDADLEPAPEETAFAPSSAPRVARPAPSRPLGPEAEVRLLEQAQDALRDRPRQALSLCDDHARDFRGGMLVQEREVIAIEALVKLGRPAEARARAAAFKTRFPGSSHTRRIEALTSAPAGEPERVKQP
jgi:hypothetical protein